MKTTKTIAFCLVSLIFLLTTACAVSQTDGTTLKSNENGPLSVYDDKPLTTTLLQGSGTGVWFMLANGLSECLDMTYEGSLLHITPGGGTFNVERLINKEAEFIFAHQSYAHSAVEGIGAFTEKQAAVKGICAFYPSAGQLALREDLGITTLDEIIDKKMKLRLAVGVKGQIALMTFCDILESYGLTLEEMEKWGMDLVYKSQDDAQQMFADSTIDGYFLAASAPSPIITENSVSKSMTMVKFSDGLINMMRDEYGYEEYTIPAGTYSFMDEDYHTFTNYTILATSTDVVNDKVYKLTKSICQNLDYIRSIHACLKNLDEEMMIGKLKIPMHPGAMEYYKEAGLLE